MMTSKALKNLSDNNKITHSNFAVPLLKRINKEGRQEFEEMQQAFELMGWEDLPERLKMEIYEDVKFMVMELKGLFSSCDPHVKRRRESVHYWVSSFRDGICKLDTAVEALKVRPLQLKVTKIK